MAETSDDEKAAEPPLERGPAERDEIDPELVRLPRARTNVRPIMALAIIAICLTLLVRLVPDLIFSRQSSTPMRVDDVAHLSADLENRFVEIHVSPDRPQAVRILPTGSSVGEVLMPGLGTSGKLWLLLPASPWTGPHATREIYRGRLLRMADMDFVSTLRHYVGEGHNVPRPIALSEVRHALASGAMTVRNVAGDVLTVHPSTFVQVYEVAENRARVYAVSTDPYDNEAAWRLALEGAGILPPETAAVSSDTGSWTFDVPAPEGVEAIREKLVQARLFAASADEIGKTREGSWSELSLDGQDILLGQPDPGFQTEYISVGAALELPAEAFLLNTSEQPGTYWYVPALVLLLSFFILLFALGLYRTAAAARAMKG